MDETGPLTPIRQLANAANAPPTRQLANSANAAPTCQFAKTLALFNLRICLFLRREIKKLNRPQRNEIGVPR
jgi:hypothetical protein